MTVSRLPIDPGRTGWNAVLEAPEPPKPLETNATADWLIIGAGFAGLAAARRLAQIHPGDRIAVLDAVRVGHGPAGRNSGFMIDLPHDLASENYGGAADGDSAMIAANRRAIDYAVQTAREYGLPDEALQKSGKINAAASDRGLAHNRAYGTHLASLDEPFEMLDAAQMHAVTGSRYYRGGLFTPGTAMLQPALFVRGMAAGLASNRVAIHEMSPVIELVRVGQAWQATTPAGTIVAPRVILTVNGHVESFGHYRRRLVHVHLYASMTRALSDEEVAALSGEPAWGLTPADPMGTTVRKIAGTGGHRIVVRNRCDYTPGMSIDQAQLDRAGSDHIASFRARFPDLVGVEMEHLWGGRLCLSLNGVSAWGQLEDGLYSACCQNGLGTARGTLAGIAAAELASGMETENTRLLSDEPAPRRLPPEPLARIGATARIRWGERSAGAEY